MLNEQVLHTEPQAAVLGASSARSTAQTITLRLEGELDIYTAGTLSNRLPEPCARLVIDLSRLRFMDCAGLRLLIDIRDQIQARHGYLYIQGAPRQVRRIFSLAGVECEFNFLPADAAVTPEGSGQ